MTTQLANIANAVNTPDSRRFAEMVPRNGHNPIFFGYSLINVGSYHRFMDEVTGANLEVTSDGVRVLWTDVQDPSRLKKEGVGIRPPEADRFVVVRHPEARTGYRLLYLGEPYGFE